MGVRHHGGAPGDRRAQRLTPLVRFSRSGAVIEPGCAVGQHTDAVLREIGYDDGRIAALRAAGIVGGPGRTEPAGTS